MNKAIEVTDRAPQSRPALRVMMLGMRGFPDVQGGVERHVERLSCALAEFGCRVQAVVRSNYVGKGSAPTWRGIEFLRLWAPPVTGFEAFVHTFFGVLRAAVARPDILHIHAIGPAFFTPLARALGLRVVVTYHSLNYQHRKWGRLARAVLRLGEWLGMAFAHGRIAVSAGLAEEMTRTYRVPVKAIGNGIEVPPPVRSSGSLTKFGLVSERYALTVARIDEAKRPLDLISAYARLRAPRFKLALVGGADYASGYARAVAEAARQTPGVVLLGHQTGEALAQCYAHAGVFVLASSHEGQPIAVLEAASFGLPVILSDIAAHREIGIERARYFPVGDIAALTDQLEEIFSGPTIEKLDARERARIMAAHDWRTIARQTLAVYDEALLVAADAGSARSAKELP